MKKLTYTIVAISIMAGGCTKEKVGPPGEDGKDGNANVKSMTVTLSGWNWNGTNSYNYATIVNGDLTPEIVNSGAVLVYMKLASGEYCQLPRVTYFSGYSISQRFVYDAYYVDIIIQYSDLSNNSSTIGSLDFKVITMSSSARLANPDVDYENYNEVKRAFHLTD